MSLTLPVVGKVLFFRGATAWEGAIGRFWFRISYPAFWPPVLKNVRSRLGVLASCGIEPRR